MRAGVVTPVATLNPRFFQSWEAEAGIEAIEAVATTAERLGYHHVTCSEHIAIAADKVPVRGASGNQRSGPMPILKFAIPGVRSKP